MSSLRLTLEEQIQRDGAFFDDLSANVKNALAGEVKSFWPPAREIWAADFRTLAPSSDNDVSTEVSE